MEEMPSAWATPVPPINDQEVDQFAEACVAIEEIYAETAEKFDAEQAGAEMLIVEAEGRVIRAVECSGLRLDEFNRIAKRMESNGKVRARIERKIEEHRAIVNRAP